MILDGNPPVRVELKRNARARRMTLRVSGVDGKVTLSMPKRLCESEARAFAEEKAPWIRAKLAEHPEATRVVPGTQLMFEGRMLPVVTAPKGRSAYLENGAVFVPGDPELAGTRLAAFLKLAARDRLIAASDRYAAELGVSYTAISLRDTRSRWGSCSTQGRLMYSWRLVMAPPQVLEYVAAHEVAHLREMNHSPSFWKLVASVCPGYEQQKRWLRRHGSGLHAVQFS